MNLIKEVTKKHGGYVMTIFPDRTFACYFDSAYDADLAYQALRSCGLSCWVCGSELRVEVG